VLEKRALAHKSRAPMIRSCSSKQLTISEFDWSFEMTLDKNNRWVKLSQCIPLYELAESYYKQRQQHQPIESGMQRFSVQRRTSSHDLPKTVESRGVPYIIKIQRGVGKVTAQNNHIFMSIYAVFQLECCLKIKRIANHFTLRTKKPFIKANQIAYEELQKLRTALHQLINNIFLF
jgi:hypothetical protein